MEKALLSKEEVVALEDALEVSGGDKSSMVHWHAQDLWDGVRAPLNNLDLDTVIRALYIGYEIEVNPEEKVKSYYLSITNDTHAAGQRAGILNTLNFLNIRIKGVNC